MLWTIPLIKIEPFGITITDQYYSDENKRYGDKDRYDNLLKSECESYTNFSMESRKRLKRALHLLLAISKIQSVYDPILRKKITFRINFITLTLCAKQGIHTDKEIKHKLLNDFLQRMRQNEKLRHYIWKAETQKNGNIHFHITSNKYINYQYIRDTWNNVQKKLGYIDLFNEKHSHINPNSTDVHKVINIEKTAAYIQKYISKIEEDRRIVEGKVWDCSRSLKPDYKCNIYGQGENVNILNWLEDNYADRLFTGEYFKFIPFECSELKKILPAVWKEKFNDYLEGIEQGKSKQEYFKEQMEKEEKRLLITI